MKGIIQTVCGTVEPHAVGAALMHEHILGDVSPPGIPESEDIAVKELKALKKSGMSTVVELSSAGLKRNPQVLERVSREAGINIVMGCGYYTEPYLDPEVKDKKADKIALEIISDIQTGAPGTGIRAGIIGEIDCSGSWTDLEKRVMEAAVTAYPFQPQIDLPNDGMRLKAVRALIERGHLDQIVISHDICTKTRLRSFGGHGYTHISDNIVPLMKIKNFSEEEITAILMRNPVRLLTMV